MSEESTEAPKPKKRAATTGKYRNAQERLAVFTSKGMILPGKTVILPVKEAELHGEKLEKV
jgi:hypothetical protein